MYLTMTLGAREREEAHRVRKNAKHQEGGECEQVSAVGLEVGLLGASQTVWSILQCTPKERNLECLYANCCRCLGVNVSSLLLAQGGGTSIALWL